MKQLILTADDFGMAPCVNEAVGDAHRDGVLTSASVMVSGRAFEDAVRSARQMPSLAVGLHLVLLRGRATLPQRHIPDLVDGNGEFRSHPARTGLRYFFQRRLQSQLEAEMRAQIEKFLSAGMRLDHVDGHLNIHMHPTVWRLVVKLCAEYKCSAVRVPSQPWWQALTRHRQHPVSKTLHAAAFRPLSARARRGLGGTSVRCASRVHGLLESGNMNEAYLLQLLDELPDGLTEIYFHPAKRPCAEFGRWNRHSNAEGELRALTSPRVRDFIRQSDIQLVTYGSAGGN